MKEISIILVLIVCAINVFAAAQKKTGKIPQVLFWYSFTSNQPGVESAGWFIDSDGNIRSYEAVVSSPVTLEPAKKGYISKKGLERNFRLAVNKVGTLDGTFLSAKAKLIKQAAAGPYSPEVLNPGAQESKRYFCYIWSAWRWKYREVLIKESGAKECVNQNASSRELIDWLEGIESSRHMLKEMGKKVKNEK